MLNLCMMTVDRYIAILFPYKYMSVMSRRCVAFLVTLCWSVPLLTSLISLTWIASDEKQRNAANSVFYPTISLLFVITCYLILIPATLHVRSHYTKTLQAYIHEVNMQLKFNHGYEFSLVTDILISWQPFLLANNAQLRSNDITQR